MCYGFVNRDENVSCDLNPDNILLGGICEDPLTELANEHRCTVSKLNAIASAEEMSRTFTALLDILQLFTSTHLAREQ